MKKSSNKIIKGVKIGVSALFYLIIVLLLLFSIATLTRKTEKDIPNLFGFGFLAVNEKADSMVGTERDSFNPNDLIFVRVLNKKQRDNLDLEKLYEKRTVVSFFDMNRRVINTHRVVNYHQTTNTVETKGDNAPIDEGHLNKVEILAIYQGKIKGAGKVVAFMQTQLGFGLVVIAPMLVLLGIQGYALIRNVYRSKEVKLKAQLDEQQAKERELMKKELLEELKKQQENK